MITKRPAAVSLVEFLSTLNPLVTPPPPHHPTAMRRLLGLLFGQDSVLGDHSPVATPKGLVKMVLYDMQELLKGQ
jgi:hypothetical protein